jgi:hypothetical protein
MNCKYIKIWKQIVMACFKVLCWHLFREIDISHEPMYLEPAHCFNLTLLIKIGMSWGSSVSIVTRL